MPSAGINRLATGELASKKKKGKDLVKAVGEAFAPEKILEINRKINQGDPWGGTKPQKPPKGN